MKTILTEEQVEDLFLADAALEVYKEKKDEYLLDTFRSLFVLYYDLINGDNDIDIYMWKYIELLFREIHPIQYYFFRLRIMFINYKLLYEGLGTTFQRFLSHITKELKFHGLLKYNKNKEFYNNLCNTKIFDEFINKLHNYFDFSEETKKNVLEDLRLEMQGKE